MFFKKLLVLSCITALRIVKCMPIMHQDQHPAIPLHAVLAETFPNEVELLPNVLISANKTALFQFLEDEHLNSTAAKVFGLKKRLDKRASNIRFDLINNAVFDAQNRARMNPKGFSQELRNFGETTAADIILNSTPVHPLAYQKGLFLAANDMVIDQVSTSTTGHIGSDGSTPYDRISKYGSWYPIAGENIIYGGTSVLNVLAGWIKSPGHFANLVRPAFYNAGVSCGYHPIYAVFCVVDFTANYIPK